MPRNDERYDAESPAGTGVLMEGAEQANSRKGMNADEQLAIADLARIYKKQAADCRGRARGWLFAAFLVCLGTLLAIVDFLIYFRASEDPVKAVQVIGVRPVVLGLLVAVIVWCGRMYRLHSLQSLAHSRTMARISALEPLLTIAENEETRRAIIRQAAGIVYDRQFSDSIGGGDDSGDAFDAGGRSGDGRKRRAR